MSQLKTKKAVGRKRKDHYRINEILLEQGKDAKWLADILKTRFKVNKKTTYAIVKNEILEDIMINMLIALVLKVKIKEIFNN